MNYLPNILIVDDNNENLLFLEAVIKKIDVNLIKALSGSEALGKTRGIDLALAIIDVRMPGMNGYELALLLNEERSEEKVPVIFLTANNSDDIEMFKGYSFGAVDYLIKPLSNHILLSKIKIFIDLFLHKQIIISDNVLLKKYADELFLAKELAEIAAQKFNNLYDFAPTGYVSLSKEKTIQEINYCGARLLGKERSKLIGSHFGIFVSKNTLSVFNAFFENLFKGEASEICEVMIETQDNKSKYVHIEGMVDGNNNQCLLNLIDITERKWAEDELKSSLEQLHLLTQHIEKVREDERVAISRELHDDLGQALTAVKIDLTIIRKNISDSEVVLKINKVAALVGETIKTVQRITSQLRPEIIDDLGLKAAIEWYTKEFSQRIGVKIFLDIDSTPTISPKASLVIFRIIQESLTNIARHAKATRVDISLLITDEDIRLRILDNGIGITSSEINSKKSFGIMSMKERAASLGGTFEISSGNGGGTEILLIIQIIEQLNL
jgi:PAS domain S-box-containing protein